MFDNHNTLLFWLQNKQTFRVFSLRDLHLVCLFALISTFYPQINGVGNPLTCDQALRGGGPDRRLETRKSQLLSVWQSDHTALIQILE